MMSDSRKRNATRTWLAVVAGVAVGAIVTVVLVTATPVGSWLSTRTMSASAHEHQTHDQLWTCPMHPQIVEAEPGTCPICGMDLVPIEPEASAGGQPPPSAAGEHAAEQLWTCPMHPQIVEHESGTCPICGMDLVRVKTEPAGSPSAATAAGAHGESPSGERKILFYRNPMDPTVTSPVPRKDDMGMDYVPVYADEVDSAVNQGAVVTIDPVVQQNMNVTTERAKMRDISRQIRTVGYLGYDQDAMVTVTTKYPGFVEKAYVNYVGQPITKGEPLFEIYAPELVQTQQELLSAVQYLQRLENAPDRARERAEALVEAARQRLDYWDISPDQIDRISSSGEVMRTLVVTAPASGVAMQVMHGLDGMRIQPGMDVIHIAGMRSLWLTVEIFEDQLRLLDVGSTAKVSFTYLPGENFSGRVRYIEPEVDEKTRTIQFTLAVPNPTGRLRVGMYATVVFEPVAARDAVAVPKQAVLRTGERNVVVVALGDGRFAPRDVTLGFEGDDYVQVLDGVQPGEEIVTSAQFLIDSESNLRAAIQKMTGR